MLRRLAWSSLPSAAFSATRLSEVNAPSGRYNQRTISVAGYCSGARISWESTKAGNGT